MSSNYTLNRSRCNGCLHKTEYNNTYDMKLLKLATLNEKITKSISQSNSQYLGNLGSLEVFNHTSCNKLETIQSKNKASQASDRYYKAKVPITAVVPTRGNSIKRTQTSLRPGSLGPGGIGVDVKHNSYARYLAKKKGKAIFGEYIPNKINQSKKIINNKFMKPKIIARNIRCKKKNKA